jgi:hypothetical protein
MIDTCAIWGTTSYVNSWVPVNVLVILISMLAIAAAYTLTGFVPYSYRGKLRGFVRFEMIQMMVSILILGMVLAFSATACSLSAQMSSSLVHTQMDPFTFADYYVSHTFNNGLTLLTNMYSTSVSYAIDASGIHALQSIILRGFNVGGALGKGSSLAIALTRTTVGGASGAPGGWLQPIGTLLVKVCKTIGIGCEYESIPSGDFGSLYNNFASVYLDVFAPILIVAVGMMFIQFLAIPIMQFSAFTIVLPTALALRSIAFFSSGLGDASNALIALAVALYIVYPMMVAFDSYAISWVFSTNNPAAQYVGSAFTVNSVAPSFFFQTNPAQDISAANAMSAEVNFTEAAFSAPGSYKYYLNALNLVGTMHNYTDNMAQFFFESILLFALNMAVTVGLAVSLYKALKSGLGEAGRFW